MPLAGEPLSGTFTRQTTMVEFLVVMLPANNYSAISRLLSQTIIYRRGGNAGNSSVVLAQLLDAAAKNSGTLMPRVQWIGTMANPSQVASMLIVLQKASPLCFRPRL